MHTVHLLLVEADDAEDIGDGIVPEADWYDWFEIGGRWDGLFDGANILPMTKCEDALRALDQVDQRQNATLLEITRLLSGRHITAADVPGSMFGLPIPDPAHFVKATNERADKTAAAWAKVLAAETMAEAGEAANGHLLGYYLERLGKLIDGDWTPDSGFLDTVNYTSNPRPAVSRVGSEGQFLVVVDFHY